MLEKIPIFKSLSSERLNYLENISIIKKYKKGEIVFYEGEKSDFLLLLIKGTLRIYKTSSKYKELFLHEIRPVSFVAEYANFNELPYPASCATLNDVTIVYIDYKKFKDEFLRDPDICFEFVKSISGKIKALENTAMRSLLNCENKVANFIFENFDFFKSTKYTKIAEILNITPETFSRVITKFKKEGVFVLDDDGKIIDYDKTKLGRFL